MTVAVMTRTGSPGAARRSAAGDLPRSGVAGPPPGLLEPDVAFIVTRVRPYLGEVLAAEQTRWSHQHAPWCDPIHTLREFLSRGKALRPRFCFWGHAATTGRAGTTQLVAGCAALELLHGFALIHDDLMDAAMQRRGRPALHRELAAEHARRRWSGPADRYGSAVAMLTGDLAFALACRLVGDLPRPVRAVWNRLIGELTMGQFLDLAGAARADRSAALAGTVARLKSGRYTVAGPLRLGAAIAGQRLPAALGRYGEMVGEAFQLRDDLLGVFGDPAVTGKPVGDDLRSGKPTLLLAYAAERATPAQRALLNRVGAEDLGDDEINALTAVVADTGARARVEARIARAVDRALAALADHRLPPSVAAHLRVLAEAATYRDT